MLIRGRFYYKANNRFRTKGGVLILLIGVGFGGKVPIDSSQCFIAAYPTHVGGQQLNDGGISRQRRYSDGPSY